MSLPLPHERLAVLIECGYDARAEIAAWVREHAEQPELEWVRHDLMTCAPHQRCQRFAALSREQLGFEMFSARGAEVVAAVLPEACELTAAGKIAPNNFVFGVESLDAGFCHCREYPSALEPLYSRFSVPANIDWNATPPEEWSAWLLGDAAEIRAIAANDR